MSGRTEGALYELVSRGLKDKYFFDNSGGISLFSAKYNKIAPHLSETRRQVSINVPQFGRPLEFELDCFADVLTEAAFIVELPALLPTRLPLTAAVFENGSSQHLVDAASSLAVNHFVDSDNSGCTYGYCSGAPYYLFERIQIFQDKILIQDITGDSLLAVECTLGSYNIGQLNDKWAGVYNEEDRAAVCRSSVPSQQLRVKVPLPGCQGVGDGGFPLCAVRDIGSSIWRIRLVLRKLEDILIAVGASGEVISGDARLPFNKTLIATDLNGEQISCVALPRESMRVNVLLETTQTYLQAESIAELRNRRIEIPFKTYYDQDQSFGPLDYAPLNRGSKAIAQVRIEGRHPVNRMIFFYRLQADLLAGRLNPRHTLFDSLYFLVAGKERELEWSSLVWNNIENLTKNDRVPLVNKRQYYYHINWSLGSQQDRGSVAGPRKPDARQPEGTVNFTTADRPTLIFNLVKVLQKKTGEVITIWNEEECKYQDFPETVTELFYTELQVCCESWGTYVVEDGRAKLMFAN
jgi:hypothetical protein